MNFYKELNFSGKAFFWVYLIKFFATQTNQFLQEFSFKGIINFYSADWLPAFYTFERVGTLLGFIFLIYYSLSCYNDFVERKKSFLQPMYYIGMFFIVYIGSSAVYPGLEAIVDGGNLIHFFLDRIEPSPIFDWIFFTVILKNLFKKIIQNIFIRMIIQILSLTLVTYLAKTVLLFILLALLDINSGTHARAIELLGDLNWPSLFTIFGMAAIFVFGPLAAFAVHYTTGLVYFLLVAAGYFPQQFLFNQILACFVMLMIFYRYKVQAEFKNFKSMFVFVN